MNETKIGNHAVTFEPPDLFCIAAEGDISEEDLNAINEHMLAASAAVPDILLLADLGRLGDIERDARKSMSRAKRPPYRAIAICKASFAARIAATLVMGAMRMLSKGREIPIRFFSNEADARAWLATQRPR